MPARTAYAWGMAAVLCWSTAASAFKLALRGLSPAQLQFVAVATAWLALAAQATAQGTLGRAIGSMWSVRPAIRGLLNPFLYYHVLLRAYARLPAQEALVLNYLWPVSLAVLSVPLLRQPLTSRAASALGLSFLGVATIGTRGHVASLRFEDPQGVILAVGSSVVWALSWLANLRDPGEPLTKLLQSFTFGVAFTGLALWWSHPMPWTWEGVGGAVYVGLFEMGIPFPLWLGALRRAPAAKIANLVFLSPCLSLLLVHVVVGESLRWFTLVGFGLVAAGIAVQLSARQPTGKTPRA